MDPTEPPPLFPGQDRGPSKSPPWNPPLAGCAAGSSSPSPSQSARVDALCLPTAPSPELPEDTLDPTESPPLFPGQDRRPSKSLERNPPLAGCAGGSSSASPSQSGPVDACPSPAASPPELREDALMAVFGTLEIPDLVRAGAVCTSWRSAYVTLRDLGKYKQSQTPCLLYTTGSDGENVACLYSLVEKRVYRLTLPEPPICRRFFIGSSLGFLVTVDERSEMHLLNPITGEQIALPPAITFHHVNRVLDDSGAVHSYEYLSYSGEIIGPASLRDEFHHRAIVFSDTSTSYIVVLIHDPHDQLSFARVGDDKWTWLPPHTTYQDCTYKDGLLYAVTITGEIHAFDLSGPAVTMKIIMGMDRGLLVDTIYILQAPWGGLVLVSRKGDYHHEIVKIRCVDTAVGKLVEINCLDDHALFLGHNRPQCLSTKEYPALKGNHAYLTDDHGCIADHKNNIRDIGVLDMDNNSKEDLVFPRLWSSWPAPVWITLNLTRMTGIA